MYDPHQTPPWLFILDGTFVGFLEHDSVQPKYLTLDVEQESMAIKLPQNLRQSLPDWLQPGARIRCIGRSQLDLQSKALKLNAYQVFALPGQYH